MNYEPVIGLEVHIQLLTESKIFCSCSTKFGAKQNSQVCPVCLGLPGVLPVLNKKVVDFAIKLALATNCKINKHSIFARKNYFYPDLPKGYQISQFEEPFCEHGILEILDGDGSQRNIRILRIHMEEDAGKSMHSESYVSKNETLVDVNRCGVPLLEMVSQPDLHSPKEAYNYLYLIRQIVRYLGICDGNMEEGSLRCDANISMRPVGSEKLGVKTEVKNMNSIHNVEKALEFEIARQTKVLQAGGHITQQTLLWDADRNVAEPMRSKEESHDYRYFPEPDLVPIEVDQKWIQEISETLPELPQIKKQRFMEEYNIPSYDADMLTEDLATADYFEKVAQNVKDKKTVSNWVMGEVRRALNKEQCEISQLKVTPQYLSDIINMIEDKTISGKLAKVVFQETLNTGNTPKQIVKNKGLEQITDTSSIEKAVEEVLQNNPKERQEYLDGKERLLGFFIGQIMRATSGKANPKAVNDILRDKLSQLKKN